MIELLLTIAMYVLATAVLLLGVGLLLQGEWAAVMFVGLATLFFFIANDVRSGLL